MTSKDLRLNEDLDAATRQERFGGPSSVGISASAAAAALVLQPTAEDGSLFSANRQAREIDERANFRSELTRRKSNANHVEQRSFGDLDDVRGVSPQRVFRI